jgi:hypothetical protein
VLQFSIHSQLKGQTAKCKKGVGQECGSGFPNTFTEPGHNCKDFYFARPIQLGIIRVGTREAASRKVSLGFRMMPLSSAWVQDPCASVRVVNIADILKMA